MTSPGPSALTASRASVTKASGLSDALGAERSLNGEDGDTVTHRCMEVHYRMFLVTIGYPLCTYVHLHRPLHKILIG